MDGLHEHQFVRRSRQLDYHTVEIFVSIGVVESAIAQASDTLGAMHHQMVFGHKVIACPLEERYMRQIGPHQCPLIGV